MCIKTLRSFYILVLCIAGVIGASLMASLLSGCSPGRVTPTASITPTVQSRTPTPTQVATPTLESGALFHTYAYGELLPDMRVPVQRSTSGEGGWYVIIGTEEGWAEFLSQMGQPAEIWQDVEWDKEILIGVLLGLREGRQHRITIADLNLSGIEVETKIVVATPEPDQAATFWITYPFHFVRVPRIELPLGPATFRFTNERGQELASQVADANKVTIIWLAGMEAAYPTPTPVLATPTPEPTPTLTPVPNLQILGIVLDVSPEAQSLRIVPETGRWQKIKLMEGSSILLQDGQPTSLTQLESGMTVRVLGYAGEENVIRAAHINILSLPVQAAGISTYQPRPIAISTIYDGYDLPLSPDEITAPSLLTQTFGISQTRVLTENGFIVRSARYTNFGSLYNDPKYSDYPIFISTDSILHVTQLLFDRVYRSIEQTHLEPELAMLDKEMYDLAWEQYDLAQTLGTAPGGEIAAAARQNAAYFAVALALLDPDFTPPDPIAQIVNTELSLITATQAISISPIFDSPTIADAEKLRIDYAQFDLDRYDGLDAAQVRYAQAMIWHRAVIWHLEQRRDVLNIVLLSHALQTHPAARLLWQRVHALLLFFDGQKRAGTPADYGPIAVQVWGPDPDISSFGEQTSLAKFVEEAAALPPDNRIQALALQSGELPGFTFMGQRYQIDQHILEWTIGGDTLAGLEKRLPSAIHLAAALGSPEAYSVASQMGYGAYTDYFDQVRIELDSLPDKEWTAELSWNWLYAYRLLIQDKNLSYPKWMRTQAWRRRELQTMLGSWTDSHTNSNVPRAIEPLSELEQA
ncbi:MAG: DUF3160 domain-containing protein, partial [Anaerolineae bacterium]|nr:DUF3160 domain-containing protein [Anaerolineae bacterium]